MWLLLAAGARLAAQPFGPPTGGQSNVPLRLLRDVGIEQKVNAQMPLDLPFANESGQQITLRQYTGKPLILALVYYQCPSLCNRVLSGLVRSVKGLSMTAGDEFEVVAVSFDPRETPALAAAKKQTYAKEYGSPGGFAGWHFLTGQEAASKALSNTVGFRYAYDAMTNQYIHPSAIVILTPGGLVARYLYGVEYPSRDLRLALVEASNGAIGTPVVDQVLLYCFHYDPASGKYGFVVMNLLRAGALITLAVLLTFMVVMIRRDRVSAPQKEGTG